MGTRGVQGFRFRQKDYLTYNHFDSYPEGLGIVILQELQRANFTNLLEAIERIVLVEENGVPTIEQVLECAGYTDLSVATQNVDDWYCLLRQAQFGLTPWIFNGLRYMLNYNDFICDSLFCEYGYIVNLDTRQLEFWVGGQKKLDPTNRYGANANGDNGYYPCRLAGEFDLAVICGSNDEQLVEKTVSMMLEYVAKDEQEGYRDGS